MVSVKATARGIVSDMPIVSGLGPREDPSGMEVVLKVDPLSERAIGAGPFCDLIGWWKKRNAQICTTATTQRPMSDLSPSTERPSYLS